LDAGIGAARVEAGRALAGAGGRRARSPSRRAGWRPVPRRAAGHGGVDMKIGRIAKSMALALTGLFGGLIAGAAATAWLLRGPAPRGPTRPSTARRPSR